MIGFKFGLLDGRHLLIRPLLGGEGVQLGIIGKRGGLVEAAQVGLDNASGVLAAIDEASEIAWQERQQLLDSPPSPRFNRLVEEGFVWT
jgi:hypothetical protein